MKPNLKLGLVALLFLVLTSFCFALQIDDNVYFSPSTSNTTYQVIATANNISVNATHLGTDDRYVQLENGSTLYANVTTISTRTSLAGETLYTITYEIAGRTLFTTNVSFDADYVKTAGYTINGVQFLTDYFTFYGLLGTLRVFEAETFEFHFYDAVSGDYLNETTIDVEIISDEFSIVTNTTNGFVSLDLLPSPGEYNIRYSATGYDESFYYFVIADTTTNNISLYLYNASDTDLISVLIDDTAGDSVEGALVKVLRYDSDTNSYVTITSKETNTEGYIVFAGTLNEEYYKFIVEYPAGTVRKITVPSYLFSTSLEIEISLDENVLEDYFNKNDIVGRVRWVDPVFSFFYTDPNEIVTQGCLETYALAGSREILVDTSCVAGDTNTIAYTPNFTQYNSYRADAYVTYKNQYVYLESAYETNTDDSFDERNNLIYALLLTIPLFLIFLWSPAIAVSVLPLPTLAMAFVGFINVNPYAVLAIQIVCIAGGFLIGKRG